MGLQHSLEKASTAEIRSMPVQTRKYQSECHARVWLRGLRGQDCVRAGKAPVTLLRSSLVWDGSQECRGKGAGPAIVLMATRTIADSPVHGPTYLFDLTLPVSEHQGDKKGGRVLPGMRCVPL